MSENQRNMTNFERLFQEQMNDPEFAKAYHESQLERIFCEFLENMKEIKIYTIKELKSI